MSIHNNWNVYYSVNSLLFYPNLFIFSHLEVPKYQTVKCQISCYKSKPYTFSCNSIIFVIKTIPQILISKNHKHARLKINEEKKVVYMWKSCYNNGIIQNLCKKIYANWLEIHLWVYLYLSTDSFHSTQLLVYPRMTFLDVSDVDGMWFVIAFQLFIIANNET